MTTTMSTLLSQCDGEVKLASPNCIGMIDMSTLNSLLNYYVIIGILVPGLIILFVRSQFLTGRDLPRSSSILSYLAVSLIYYAIAFPLIEPIYSTLKPEYAKKMAWFALVFLGPAVLGLLLGISIQKDLLRRLLRWCCLNPVHPVPTAWDWKFGGMPEQWVLVTLKDATRFAGLCGADSFISSDPAERDIYIQMVYDLNDDDKWLSCGEKSVLIAGGEIKTVEFWPYVTHGGE